MKFRQRKGFLLLDVMLAAGLIAIAMVALIESLTRCIAAARSIQNYSTAQTLLANKSYEFHVERPLDYLDQEGKFDDYPSYSWRRTLEQTDTEGLWQQTISVFWNERSKEVSDSVVEYRYIPDK